MTRSRGARSSRARFVAGIAFFLLAIFLIIGLLTFERGASVYHSGPLAARYADAVGVVGQAGARLCLDALGWGGGWFFPVLLIVWGWNRLRRHPWPAGLVPTLLAGTLAVALASLLATFWQAGGGGAVGVWVARGARALLGPLGSLLLLGTLAVLAVGFVAERETMALLRGIAAAGRGVAAAGRGIAVGIGKVAGWLGGRGAEAMEAAAAARAARREEADRRAAEEECNRAREPVPAAPAARKAKGRDEKAARGEEAGRGGAVPPVDEPRIVGATTRRAAPDAGAALPAAAGPAADPTQLSLPVGRPPREPLAGLDDSAEEPVAPIAPGDGEAIELPGPDILSMPADLPPPVSEAEILESSKILTQTLADFGVVGRVGEVHPGPVITSYEFEPAAGIRISQILNRADDLALALRAIRIRIVAPIPGKAAVGVEIPNRNPATVYLKEVVDRPEFLQMKKGLPIALGRDIGGRPYYTELTRMPHLLIAGTTGSGKSVCVNSILCGLLTRMTPRELRLLLIDPKMLELPIYNGVPHLLMPVVTDPKQASRTLRGLITEMERRYALLARRGVRNIDAYHERLDEDVRDGCEVIGERLPYIVAVIDELADLMITTAAEVEEPIGRLAQTARAVGIHLIVATQRPSVDVITGVIKANFPSRIAFQVASRTDSRTILDMNGAESLLGRGDMLFMLTGRPEVDRVHGAFVSDRDTEKLVRFWKRVKPKLPSIDLEAERETDGAGGMGSDDALFEDAARLVVLHQQGSASLLQRRLKVGYSRAARLVDMLEEAGIVAPSEGSKAREVLVDDVRLEQLLRDREGEALKQ